MQWSRGDTLHSSNIPANSKNAAADYSTSDSSGDDDDEHQLPGADPGAGEFRDFNPRKRRRTGRDAKESAALGIFGSESEDDRPGRRWQKKTLRSKGMSFVSSGTKKEEDAEEEDDEYAGLDSDGNENGATTQFASMKARYDEDEQEDEEEDEEEAAPGIGLGFRPAASQGLGFAPPSQTPLFKPAETSTRPPNAGYGDAANPLGRGFMPSSASQPVLQPRDDEPAPKPQVARPSAFSSSGKKGKGGGINANSFGARMMAKMGFKEGSGLGAEGQGRHIVIEAHLRPSGVGLGAVKEKSEKERQEEKRQQRLRGEVVVDSDEEEKKKKAARRRKAALGGVASTGPNSGTSTPKRAKQKFVTVEEARKVAPGLNIPDAFTPILDLTGPGKKMLTSSSGLMTPNGTAKPESDGQAESRKIAVRAQNDFMAILEEWQSLQNQKAYTDLEIKQATQEMEEVEVNLRGHQALSNGFAELSLLDSAEAVEQRWNQIIGQLILIQESTSDDFMVPLKEEMTNIAVASIHPLFKELIREWDPLTDPSPGFVSDLKNIQDLLGVRQSSKRRSTATTYETMMYKLWYPHVSRALRDWDVRDCDKGLNLYEAWQPLLTGFVDTQFIEQLIVRKLFDAVTKWEPKKRRTVLPHRWVLPWLPYLPSYHLDPKSSSGLVSEVKRKLRQAIQHHEFYKGLVPGLRSWKDVLRPSSSNDQWTPLVMSHILPSMTSYVKSQFQVELDEQEPFLEVITGIFQWQEVMRPSMLAEVMVAQVFPALHDTLYRLLTAESPDYALIVQWYCWWVEEVFPEDIKTQPSIAAEFEKGFILINDALDLGDGASYRLEPPRKTPAFQPKKSSSHRESHRHHHKSHEHTTEAAAAPPAEPQEYSVRHHTEDWCEQHDLQFIPERKRVHAEGPLYRITARGDGRGGVLIYFKGIRLYTAESRKGNIEVRVDREADWEKLLQLAS